MKPMRAVSAAALLVVAALTYAVAADSAVPQAPGPFPGILDEHPAIQYATRPASDRVAALARALDEGRTTLSYREPAGYLNAVLHALGISPESQLLVFSKTGVQRASTSPLNPRALYFDDDVVVGYIPGARLLEIAAHDPEQGVIFYTIDQLSASAPDLERRTNCLTCHVSVATLDVPGLITRSNFTNAQGEPIPQLGFHLVDHRTPLPQRWGGWFVTGTYDVAPYGGVTHMGNVTTALHPANDAPAGTSNEILIRWTNTDVSARGYPSHESDIAALMVFDHQARAINLLTRLNWEARVAIHDRTADYGRGELLRLVSDVVDYFLFVGEVPPPARLTPRPGFVARFVEDAPRDSRGRSLRDLDLSTRLLRHPCSYMIYSPAFDGLPDGAKRAVYGRLLQVLSGGETDGKYAHLSAADRRAIIEILQETKADWPPSK
jgi:hypothetical protein